MDIEIYNMHLIHKHAKYMHQTETLPTVYYNTVNGVLADAFKKSALTPQR